ncbi:HIT domain-containing protein [Candidatus Woesearchaeota archaeon]|nr:HIT domain-containing protein [Candidatus Woesearchaeota archaeon]
MADEPSQEELLAQQKANCIFCKIVGGEMPSKVVYQDDRMEAILDIRPAVKGHCLVLTKEHYPIMPLIPPEEFAHLFGTAAQLSKAIKDGMLTPRCTTFIANGAIAGQQSPHFLFHLIPREDGDNLPFTIPENGVAQDDITAMLQQNLKAIMQQHLQKTGKSEFTAQAPPTPSPSPEQPPQSPTPQSPEQSSQPTPQPSQSPPDLEQLARIIEDNQELKDLLIKDPAKLEGLVFDNPQLQGLFAGVDIKKLGEKLRELLLQNQEKAIKGHGPKLEDVIPASQLTMQQLFEYVDNKPKLRKLMIEDPEALKALIPENERLSKFFAGSNVNAIIQAYQEYAKETQGITVTMEPVEERKDDPRVKPLKGPSRKEEGEAWDEVRYGHRPKTTLDKIGRLFK